MLLPDKDVAIRSGHAVAHRHPDPQGAGPTGTVDSTSATTNRPGVWLLWAVAGTGDAVVEVPVTQKIVRVVSMDGNVVARETPDLHLRLNLKGDLKMAPAVLVIDRSK